jgi:aldose 1-epimerase
MLFHRASFVIAALALVSCAPKSPQPTGEFARMTKQSYGKTASGEAVDLYILKNKAGMEAAITNYGGIVVSLTAPDRSGKLADVVLGFDKLDDYLTKNPYFGCIVGRYGNRIAKGRFTLNGTEYRLAVNNGENHLHGGLVGFDKKVWSARDLSTSTDAKLELSYTSKDMEEGYPGNLSVTVTYTLNDDNDLQIDYAATTDKDTVVNLTNHTYFNLAAQGDVLNHRIQINASNVTPVDKGLIPTGKLGAVKGTALDFTKMETVGARIESKEEQMVFGGGYDHNFVLDKTGAELTMASRVEEPTTGRALEVWTTEPAIQFYTGNFLDGTLSGKGRTFAKRSGFCLETQHYPDSPNQPNFPTTVLKPGQRYQTTTVWKFRTAQ